MDFDITSDKEGKFNLNARVNKRSINNNMAIVVINENINKRY
jgi:hypothetical protein